MADQKRWFPAARKARHELIAQTTTFMDDKDHRVAIGYESTTPNGKWFDTTYFTQISRYNLAYAVWINPETSTRLALDDLKAAEKDFFPLYRTFYASVKGSPLVTDANLEDMGFPPRPSGGHSPHPVDKTYIDLNVSPKGNLVIEVAFTNRDTGSSIIPYYLTGAVVYYLVSDKPVTNQNELAFSKLASKSPVDFTFDPADRSRTVSFAGRWQNRRGELGPWSEIVTVVIP
ncbi:MAG: hypothetical protein LBK07_11230 [Tannerella sp.]|jgi:hypothetical protein|nr:hypothetical protein [Tannerella sp.]